MGTLKLAGLGAAAPNTVINILNTDSR